MSTLTETIIQLRLPLLAARWRREVDRYRYLAHARVPIVYIAYNVDVDRTIYDWKSFIVDTRFDVGVTKQNRDCKKLYHETYDYICSVTLARGRMCATICATSINKMCGILLHFHLNQRCYIYRFLKKCILNILK